jgi:hypothetical protein
VNAHSKALAELVAVKQLKERFEQLDAEELLDAAASAERDRLAKEYLRRQPAAWEAARAALLSADAEPVAEEWLTVALLERLRETIYRLGISPDDGGSLEHFGANIAHHLYALSLGVERSIAPSSPGAAEAGEAVSDEADVAERRLQWMLDWWYGCLEHKDENAIGQCLCSEELLSYIDTQTSTKGARRG